MKQSFIILLILGAFSGGCSTLHTRYNPPLPPKRNYTGQSNPTSFATVFVSADTDYSISFLDIDGEDTTSGLFGPRVVDICPGYRSFGLCARINKANSHAFVTNTASFRVEEGRIYQITLESLPNKSNPCLLTLEAIAHKKSVSGFLSFSPPLTFDGQSFSDIGCLLSHWGILRQSADLSKALATAAQKTKVEEDLKLHLETVPYAQAQKILESASQLLTVVSKEVQLSKESISAATGFVIRDTSDQIIVASLPAHECPIATGYFPPQEPAYTSSYTPAYQPTYPPLYTPPPGTFNSTPTYAPSPAYSPPTSNFH